MYLEGDAGYVAAIRAHDFAVIALGRTDFGTDPVIARTASTTPGYVPLYLQGGLTWIYAPDDDHLLGRNTVG